MIVPLVLGAAALVLLGKGAADNHRHKLTRIFSKTTLVASQTEDGVYDTVVMANTTKTLTHILNAVFQQGFNAYTTPDGAHVTFEFPGSEAKMAKRGFELFMSPKNIHIHNLKR